MSDEDAPLAETAVGVVLFGIIVWSLYVGLVPIGIVAIVCLSCLAAVEGYLRTVNHD